MPVLLVNDERNIQRINYWKQNSNPPGCKYGQRSGPLQFGKSKNKEGVAKCPKICKNGWARDEQNQCTDPTVVNDFYNVFYNEYPQENINGLIAQVPDLNPNLNPIPNPNLNPNPEENINGLIAQVPNLNQEINDDDFDFNPDEIDEMLSEVHNILIDDDDTGINNKKQNVPNDVSKTVPEIKQKIVSNIGNYNPMSVLPIETIVNNEETHIGETIDLYPDNTTFEEINPMGKKARFSLQPKDEKTINFNSTFSLASKPTKKRRGIETMTENTKRNFDIIFNYLKQKSEESEDDYITVGQFVKYLHLQFLGPEKLPKLYVKSKKNPKVSYETIEELVNN
jgi:hypothetical protein